MEYLTLTHTNLSVSRLIFGCMGFGGSWGLEPHGTKDVDLAEKAVMTAVELGYTFSDLADVYRRGKSEAVFGEVLRKHPGLREKIVIQTKAGIQLEGTPATEDPARYDFSKEHLVEAAEGSLKRMGCGQIDILLLHRPDALMDPEEIAEAFADLHRRGIVKHFGVSNFSASQTALVQSALPDPLVANQLQMSLLHYDFVEVGMTVNQHTNPQAQAMEGNMEYCRRNGMNIQAWSPLAHGGLSGKDVSSESPATQATVALVNRMAKEKGMPAEAIALAWLYKHPARICPVIGTTDPGRIRNCTKVHDVELSRSEWYMLLEAARGRKVA